jgi:drug/metabolite transporter (DMT)-like permease
MSVTAPDSSASSASRPLDAVAVTLALLLCLSWGFNQVAVKLALPEIPPLMQATIRSAGAAVLVGLWTVVRGIGIDVRDGTLAAGLVAGVLFGLEFLFIYQGLLFTTASRAVLFLYTAPFVVVLGAHWLIPTDRFRLSHWIGLLLCFAAITLAFGLPTPATDARQALGDFLLLMGGISWGATTLVIKASRLNRAPAEKTLLYQLVVSTPILGAGAVIFGEQMPGMPSMLALGSLAFQTIWVVAVTYLVWFELMVRYSASRLSAFTFLTPLFGVAAGHTVMGDPLNRAFIGAVLLLALGLVLVNRPR